MSTLLIIPSYLASEKHAVTLFKCVSSLRETTDENVLIIDDGSEDSEYKEKLYPAIREKFDNIDIVEKDENSGFSSSVNIGLKLAQSNDMNACLVNADIEFIDKDWLTIMDRTDADIVGAMLLYPNFIIQHAGIYFSSFSKNFEHRFCGSPHNLPAAQITTECPVTGALQFIRKSVIDDIGLYDEEFKLGFEDVDYMIRAIDAGHKSIYNPKVKAIHHESLFRKDKTTKIKKWEGESYMHLIKKYKGKDFQGMVPSGV